MTREEEQLTVKMRLYEKHSPEWEELYMTWCDIQRKKKTHEPTITGKDTKYANGPENYNIKAKYL